jgi:glutamate dehydrogenase (NAD(P)+)
MRGQAMRVKLRCPRSLFSNQRHDRIMRDAFTVIWNVAEEHKISSRTAAFVVVCTRILRAREVRGLYP